MTAKIKINGREYSSIDELSEADRRAYELALQHLPGTKADRNGNGIPDFLEQPGGVKIHTSVHTRFVVNGKPYGSVDELPDEVRRAYERTASGAQAIAQPYLPPSAPVDLPSPDSGVRRALLAVASLAAVGLAAWLMFGKVGLR